LQVQNFLHFIFSESFLSILLILEKNFLLLFHSNRITCSRRLTCVFVLFIYYGGYILL